jgi:hypothetical protein
MTILIKGNDSNVPSKRDGTLYRYEVVLFGNADRIYADSTLDIAKELIPDFSPNNSDEQNLKAIILHATRVQAILQAHINANHDMSEYQLTREEIQFISDPFGSSSPLQWKHNLPLVLVDAFYSPFTTTPPPSTPATDDLPQSIFWLKTTLGINEYLKSLDEADFISLSIAKEARV